MTSFARPIRYGWQPVTIIMTAVGAGSMLLFLMVTVAAYSQLSITVFWFYTFLACTFFGLLMYTVAGSVSDRTWRTVASVFGGMQFIACGIFGIVVVAAFDAFHGWGLVFFFASVTALAAGVLGVVEMIQTLNGTASAPGYNRGRGFAPAPYRQQQGMDPMAPFAPPAGQIIIHNNNNAQVGSNSSGSTRRAPSPQRALGAGMARIVILDHGRPLPSVTAQTGQVFVIGRDSTADIRISDPKSSRRHLELTLEPGGWALRDLGATNPARVLSGPAANQLVRGHTVRLPSGQVSVGDAVITLYPPGGMG